MEKAFPAASANSAQMDVTAVTQILQKRKNDSTHYNSICTNQRNRCENVYLSAILSVSSRYIPQVSVFQIDVQLFL